MVLFNQVKMSNTTNNVKTELIKVLTNSEILSPSPSNQEEFPPVYTDPTFMENPRPDLDNLVQRYNDIFKTHEMYHQFTSSKLAPWRNLIEFKYFDSMYQNHRSTKRTVQMLRQQAQELLKEADDLQRQDQKIKMDIDQHLQRITRNDLRRKMSQPTQTIPRPPIPLFWETFPVAPRAPRFHPMNNFTPRNIRCFQCDSPHHLKWYCPQYRCQTCDKLSPGHSLRDCPQKYAETYDDGL